MQQIQFCKKCQQDANDGDVAVDLLPKCKNMDMVMEVDSAVLSSPQPKDIAKFIPDPEFFLG
jgi:hypothetical protein